MSSPPPRGRFRAALLLLLIAACDGGSRDPLGPGGRPDFAALSMQQQPFYWFKDTQIPLQVVPGEFVVKAAPSADAVVAARDALAGMGLDAAKARRLIRGHRVLAVARGDGSPAQTSAIARQLRAHPQITFASPNYTVQADGSPFFPLGTGASFSRSDLSVGVHTITLTATDSGGASGSAQVQITVEAGGCPPPQVTCN